MSDCEQTPCAARRQEPCGCPDRFPTWDDDEPRNLHALTCRIWTTNHRPCNCRDLDGQTATDRARLDGDFQAAVKALIAAFERHAPKGTP